MKMVPIGSYKDWGDNGFVKIRARNGDGVLLSQLYGVYPKYK